MTDGVPGDLVFTTKAKTEEERPTTTFQLDSEQLVAHRPKDSVALWIRKILVNEDDIEAVVGGYEKFLHYLFPPETRDRLFARLEDVDDEFDLNDLNAVITGLFEAWGVIDENGQPVKQEPKRARERVSATKR